MAATPTKKLSIVSNQKSDCNGYIISGRIDDSAYEAMLGLVNMYGYESISAFVRKAVLEKCSTMSQGLNSLFDARLYGKPKQFEPTQDF